MNATFEVGSRSNSYGKVVFPSLGCTGNIPALQRINVLKEQKEKIAIQQYRRRHQLFISILMKIVQDKNGDAYCRAKNLIRISLEQTHKNRKKNGSESFVNEYIPRCERLQVRLREIVEEDVWAQAVKALRLYFIQREDENLKRLVHHIEVDRLVFLQEKLLRRHVFDDIKRLRRNKHIW